eukprot:345195-Chlamydomonas_euryale.AAC.2
MLSTSDTVRQDVVCEAGKQGASLTPQTLVLLTAKLEEPERQAAQARRNDQGRCRRAGGADQAERPGQVQTGSHCSNFCICRGAAERGVRCGPALSHLIFEPFVEQVSAHELPHDALRSTPALVVAAGAAAARSVAVIGAAPAEVDVLVALQQPRERLHRVARAQQVAAQLAQRSAVRQAHHHSIRGLRGVRNLGARRRERQAVLRAADGRRRQLQHARAAPENFVPCALGLVLWSTALQGEVKGGGRQAGGSIVERWSMR